MGERLNALQFEINFEQTGLSQHGALGQLLLGGYSPFDKAAPMIGAHQLYWCDKDNCRLEEATLLGSQIIHLADRTDVLINKDQEIFGQVSGIISRIESQSGTMFIPELVRVLKALAKKEYFWLGYHQSTNNRTISAIFEPDIIQLASNDLLDLAKNFCRIIVFRSPFTATHSV